MFNNVLLPYDFGNDFSSIPAQLEKVVDKDSTVIIYHVVTENDLATSVKYYNKHSNDIAKEKEEQLAPFLQELDERGIRYKVEIEFGPIKDTILEKINKGDIESGDFDLVIMSNHRVSLNIKHVLGDVTHKIAKRSPVPVLIVK
ncbi:universal stress protein [Mammaliicoccus lentus]|jgi:nucleotide-binding universal stress UspA family protein|uniref:Universal stress protein n=1 Tax=Mammaliicoccus lentus TaxID=42858 RepID=A0AAX3W587_MAMLE|nr:MULTISPECIES: universal stress protein [Mammaliicoccus]MBW0770790.1 universal stress protein [Mammaliicoccus lentus]MCD2479045.1 universal stress protein [Mammaliicoccus lentus]MCD2521286.1 universal stress protein [Mammaliicoccus lentus]MEB5686030.1 universal stress protein [Mammaliicoccus lentus]OAO30382.1 universal stress protein [Mammaliicoccus lentus]